MIGFLGARFAGRRYIASMLLALLVPIASEAQPVRLWPANGATNVNPDTQLALDFATAPVVGESGKVRITDTASGRIVDELDLALPASPNPLGRMANADGSTKAPTPPKPAGPDNPGYQFTQVGGAYFHFFPVLVRGNRATIYPHNNKLEYGRTYRVTVDDGVLKGTPGVKSWTFTTKKAPPPAGATRVTVSADGRGDFSTVQGAIDWAPPAPPRPVTIFVRNGNYEEIVYLKGKSKLTIRGESRDKTIVGYANNSAFNRIRPAFTVTDSSDIQLSTFTIKNYFIGQAEALLMRGERNVVDRMTLNGSGDAFTTHGTIYMVDSKLTGDGDTILAYAALYCLRCEIHSVGPFTWTRTPKGSHGNVFVDSKFVYVDKPLPWSITPSTPEGRKTPGVLARLPRNGPPGSSFTNFPYAEMVLIDSRTDGVPPEGWGPVQDQPDFDWSNVRLWEHNTMDMQGRPIDMTKRHPIVRELKLPADAALIADYRRPEFVLGGWKPVVRPR